LQDEEAFDVWYLLALACSNFDLKAADEALRGVKEVCV
jgi:hypothetical protein